MKQLDPKAIWLFFFGFFIGILFLAIPILWIFAFVPFAKIRIQIDLPWYVLFVINFWWLILLIIPVLLGYGWAYLSWHFYRYELREDGFRKEHGVIWKKYVTIPYERIQNVDIYRGVLARILGLSDLHIQTAGMSSTIGGYGIGGAVSEGRLPGISKEEAERLRDELIKRARGKKDQGV